MTASSKRPGPLTAVLATLAVLAVLAACTPGRSQRGGSFPSAAALSPGTRAAVVLEPGDWPTYHRDAARSGLAPGLPPAGEVARLWAARLDGAVYGQPLVVGGRVLAATENNTLYALDAATGAVLWSRHVGTPVPGTDLPCGDIDPLGITGTPVLDPATGLVLAVAELSGGRHQLVGLDIATGAPLVSREVEPPRGKRIAHQQRGALALWNGRVQITFGGLYGDCSQYVGTVLSVPVTGSGPVLDYTVPTAGQGGIWAPGGPVVDGDRLLVSVGNGASTSGPYDGSDSVLALSADLHRTDFFAPADWAQDNAADLDLGSLTPALTGSHILIAGKRGVAYALSAEHLGGVGGQLSQAPVCAAYGAAAVDGGTLYLPCDDGLTQLSVAGDGTIRPGWHVPLHGAGSPVVGGGAVWVVDQGRGLLDVLDPADGRIRQQLPVGPVPHFASPSLSGGRVFLGTMDGVLALSGA
ncbi:outer membrane protein assembly factor BamB [Kitasatospora sp. MAA4]|uniref:outer membrane protein assembly factor BamB family protein n=1 Tax=Kitasatospora sp. MAA4 TaxID=3035093 RepID=UPI002475DCEF|nr:PQQ-binding-like beta-propeller repeat protein [Kitasatospora sp. MAA4]MDH6132072.1 outer membrane protein assembly factor BamB [Kitasatospora sp. MAA4]